MLYSFMGGRCGNQMYRYAFARANQRDNEEIILDFRRVTEHRERGDFNFYDELSNFSLCDNVRVINDEKPFQADLTETAKFCREYVEFCKTLPSDDEIHRLEILLEPVFRERNIYEKLEYFEYPDYVGDRYLLGLAADSRYFYSVRDLLKKDFVPKYPELDQNKELYDIINGTNSVCVSFRWWSKFNRELAYKFGICGKTYYDEAIRRIQDMIPDVQLIVFGDDLDWVRNKYEFPKGTVFETEGNPIWEKLRLMYSCKHYIIPNSTFAWWAQFLSRNNERIVISPEFWSWTGYATTAAVESNFITIKPNKKDMNDFLL